MLQKRPRPPRTPKVCAWRFSWRSEVYRRGTGGTGRNGKRAGEWAREWVGEWRAIGGEGGRVAGRVVGGRKVVAPGVLEWPERLGERRGFPKVGWVWVFLNTHVGTVGSLEKPYE